jgi:ssDNA-binding Zn-finger/Zn-ribbon topoisomerase 1
MSTDYPNPIRLARDCPLCRAPLRLRRRREDAGLFLGCSQYPRCTFAEDFDHATAALLDRIADLEGELDELRDAKPPDLARELRSLIACAHPDRWPANPLAHEITSRLTELRSRCAA